MLLSKFLSTFKYGVLGLIVFLALGMRGVYADDIEVPPAPQLVTNAWMLIVGFKADPAAIKKLLPRGLKAHPEHRVVMNMYTVPNADQTSGFGAYTLTYLTVEVKGHDSYSLGQPTGFPGRYFIDYFNSSPVVRKFTKAVGIPAEEGNTTITIDDDGNLKAVLTVGGEPFIETTAKVGKDFIWTIGGHLNYFGLTKQYDGASGLYLRKVMQYPIPWVGSGVKIEDVKVKFKMPATHPLYALAPKKVDWAVWTKGSFVYPQPQVIHEWSSRK